MVERHVMLARAAKMRREPTEAEKRLWRYLSGAKLSGLKFRRQATIGGPIVDFFCPSKGLIVEVDGMTHDRERDGATDGGTMAQYGYATVRVTNDDVLGNMDGVLQHIEIVALGRPDRWPHPNPLP
ncbi:endonuclease domain-containing protein [Sphingopyxis sp. PET50]|uniref:endonuclease domain-containing protein n=1 Tax=Sphingopyxis sp. PET50 TaxID=2976533 RepID=UPI0021B068AE|nr:endonuclease domain-containing protein [Sphingopyxis sp. PET50]